MIGYPYFSWLVLDEEVIEKFITAFILFLWSIMDAEIKAIHQ
jgi:hypothetical protein